jgi:hypothetical protein
MDFGGFILFGLGLLSLLVGSIYVIWLFFKRSLLRWKSLRFLAIGVLLMGIFARLLYQTYWLDEALWGAAFSGDTVQARSLLAAGADPNTIGEDGSTATAAAGRNGHKEIAILLQKAGGHD